MYTMCTGVNPFRADNMLAVMKKVARRNLARWPSSIRTSRNGYAVWCISCCRRPPKGGCSRPAGSAVSGIPSCPRTVRRHPRFLDSPAFQPAVREIPAWLLTSVLPKWRQSLPPYVLDAGVLSLVMGFIVCSFRNVMPDERSF